MELREDVKRLQNSLPLSSDLVRPQADVEKSDFNLSFKVVTSGKGLKLIPIGLLEVMPGDEIVMSTDAVMRLSPLVYPVLSNMYARVSAFYAPYRALVNAYNDEPRLFDNLFANRTVTSFEWSIPAGSQNFPIGSLFDYFGYDNAENGWGVIANPANKWSAMPFVMYQMIRNDYIRNPAFLDAAISYNWPSLPKFPVFDRRNWDLYAGLKSGQMSGFSTQVSIALDFLFSFAPVSTNINGSNLTVDVTNNKINISGQSAGTTAAALNVIFNDALADSASLNVSDVRNALIAERLVSMLSSFNRTYGDVVQTLFRVEVPQALDTVKLLWSVSHPVLFGEVFNTSDDVGSYKGSGVVALEGDNRSYEFSEHGLIMFTVTLVPENIYSTGCQPQLMRAPTPQNLPNPVLAAMSDRVVDAREVASYDGVGPTPIGYVSRYDEYRSSRSIATGRARYHAPQPLRVCWQYARLEGELDAATFGSFDSYDEDVFENLFVYPDNEHWIGVFGHRIKARRALPYVAPVSSGKMSIV